MGRRPQIAIVGARTRELGEVQGFNDLRVIWTAVKQSELGHREPLRPDVKEKIVKSLIATLEAKTWYRTKILAGAILHAIANEDWERDVYRKPTQRNRRHRRTRD